MNENYPKPILLINGKWTFKEEDGTLWRDSFGKNGVFIFARSFSGGFATVQLGDNIWTYVDKDANFFGIKFEKAYSFNRGLAVVMIGGQFKYIDRYQNLWEKEQGDFFREIYKNPRNIFKIEKKLSLDKKFFRTALSVIKQKLEDMREEIPKEKVDAYQEKLNNELRENFSDVISKIRKDKISLNQNEH